MAPNVLRMASALSDIAPYSGSGNYEIPKGAKNIAITEDNGVRVVQ